MKIFFSRRLSTRAANLPVYALAAALVQTILAPARGKPYRGAGFARAHGTRTYEPRQGRNAATAVCSASAVVALAFL
jgi:hypothetical protein